MPRRSRPAAPSSIPPQTPPHPLTMSSQAIYVSLSLIGLCGLVGAGVAVGSG
jgi:hypothetical protein